MGSGGSVDEEKFVMVWNVHGGVQQPGFQQLPGQVPGRFNDPRQVTVAQLDDFNNQHGANMASIIRQGGHEPQLAGQTQLLQYQVIDHQNPANSNNAIADALEDVIIRVQNGQDIDAVNMSLQSFGNDPGSARVRQRIEQLTRMNVAVLVAAGNEGAQNVNTLATPGALVVQSATGGVRNQSSGLGNIQSEGPYTSEATAALAPQVAAMMNAGMTVPQMRAVLGVR